VKKCDDRFSSFDTDHPDVNGRMDGQKITLSQKTGLVRLISHNFTNSQQLLIIFGREKPYSILNSIS